MVNSYLQTITPQVSDKWHANEVWLNQEGSETLVCHDG